jgi:RNA polymerase sigma-70 factor (ECF subfamily)
VPVPKRDDARRSPPPVPDAAAGALPMRPLERPRMLATAAYPNWDAIYVDNVQRIYRLMYSRVGNRSDAEDLTSQVFLAALGPLRASASVGEVRAYLTATARTVLAEHWRHTLGREVTDIDPDLIDLEDYDAARHAAPAPGARERAEKILAALPDRYRQILELRFLRGRTIRQAAGELGVSTANAKVLQHRALRKAAGLDAPGNEAGGRAL